MAKEIGPFRAGTKPARKGVYKTQPGKGSNVRGFVYQYWDGEQWHWYTPDANSAALYQTSDTISKYQSPRWWGLDQEAV